MSVTIRGKKLLESAGSETGKFMPVQANSWMGPLAHKFEPAGRPFLEAQLKLAGLMPYFEPKENSTKNEEEEDDKAGGKTQTQTKLAKGAICLFLSFAYAFEVLLLFR